MAKQLSRTEELSKEISLAIKEEILEKLELGKLYRSHDGKKFYKMGGTNMFPCLGIVSSGRMFENDAKHSIADELGKTVKSFIKTETISLHSGCWNTTKCPVGTVSESSVKELRKHFESVRKRLREIVDETVDNLYVYAADELGIRTKRTEVDDEDK